MATQRTHPGRSLAFVLVVLIALYAGLFLGKGGHARTPVLGIDLRGGTTVTMTASRIGGGSVTKSELNEAVNIIRNRVDGAGVGGADINTQGSDQIVVTVPGQGRNIISIVQRTALLSFRQVLIDETNLSTALSSATTPPATAPPTSASTGPQTSGSPSPATSGSTKGGGHSKTKKSTHAKTKSFRISTGSGSSDSETDLAPAAFVQHYTGHHNSSKSSKSKGHKSKASPKSTATLTPSANPTPSKGKGGSTATPTPTSSLSPTPSPTSSAPVAKLPFSASSSSVCPLIPGTQTRSRCILKRGKYIVASPTLSDVQPNFVKVQCAATDNNPVNGEDIPEDYMLACMGSLPYLLAPSTTTSSWKTGGVQGSEVSSATSGFDSSGGGYEVNINFKSSGNKAYQTLTAAAAQETSPPASEGCAKTGLGCNAVAIVLDGQVQSAPYVVTPGGIPGDAEISGSFTQSQAANLANVLNYGSLPLKLSPGTAQSISATLGSKQLRGGLIAGVISLILVVLFCMIYYRALGLVAVASLTLSGLILYSVTTELGYSRLGYTLSLAGIAGFIVAVGITADSFVVFFERLRDEVREGKRLRSGVERAWPRARRTIISADAVSLLAAVILYIVSISDVRGFAFTLGMSTLSDLFIVFFFTKPLLTVLSRREAFDRARPWTGIGRDRASRRSSTTKEG